MRMATFGRRSEQHDTLAHVDPDQCLEVHMIIREPQQVDRFPNSARGQVLRRIGPKMRAYAEQLGVGVYQNSSGAGRNR